MRRPAAGWAVLGLLIALSTALRAWGAVLVPMPWIQVDETLYSKLGQSLYRHGSLELLGVATPLYTFVYPALVGLPLTIGGLEHGYVALKVVQAAVMSLAAVPAYLWTRSLASERAAIVAAVLTLAVPSLAYSGLVMTEVAFYPLLVLAAWVSARALAEPTLQRQGVAVAVILLVCATRLQAIVLAPALLLAVALLAYAEHSRRPLRAFVPTWAAFAILAVLWALWRAVQGVTLLGGYQDVAETSYSVGDTLLGIVQHAGDVVLVTALVPAAGAALLAAGVLRRRESSPEVRASVAVVTAFTAAIVLQVGVIAPRYVGYIAERNVFSVAPLVFVGFAVWLDRGAPRTWLSAAVAALVSLGLVLPIPIGDFLTDRSLPFSFTALALRRLLSGRSLELQELVIFGVAAVLAALFALLPRRLVWLLPVAAGGVLIALSLPATRALVDVTRTQQTFFLGPVKNWVDRAEAAPAFYLYDGDRDADAVWANMFWNDDIRAVVDLPGTSVLGPLPQRVVTVWPDGTLRPPPAQRSVVASSRFAFAGTEVANAPQLLPGQAGLKLWRLDGVPRITLRMDGFKQNGDLYGGSTGRVTVYGCGGGSLRAILLIKQPQQVEIRRNGTTWRILDFKREQAWDGRIPAPPGSGDRECAFDFLPKGLSGTTLFDFER
jgi:hypothetical protein